MYTHRAFIYAGEGYLIHCHGSIVRGLHEQNEELAEKATKRIPH